MKELFYCYSPRLMFFIKSFRIPYVRFGVNKNTNQKYFVFEKSKRLDDVIELYKKVKHAV